ncbi:Per1-like protein [Schizophyllum amplum]|uniref:Post-GPI attachment to proteins factor 3 n=1 Tax=Schizophyllum amplum TaxID=97359 RepID=A0A550CGJ0_9AGAR|nr:Per1-like protein [Auriculariopsis ampla]
MRLFYFPLVFFIAVVAASSGDRAKDFRYCVDRCYASCKEPLPLALRLTGWTCLDDCRYTCMHTITARATVKGHPPKQYFGKWPFLRLLGMQEPASVFFSLVNLWAHIRGSRALQRRVPQGHPMKRYYAAWSWISANTWIWSAVFHTRDFPLTEKLDYFSAALTIMSALQYTVIRLFHLYPQHPPDPKRATTRNMWTVVCATAYVGHVTYLCVLPRFDYAYNIIFNTIIGMAHNLLWLLFALPARWSLFRRYPHRPKSYRPAFVTKVALFVALTTAATALELFDFPPWALVIDAHALWHLATVPIAIVWYQFLIEDALDESWRDPRLRGDYLKI